MSSAANLPAPYLGVNEKDPIAAVKSPYCQNLFNFNVTTAGISLRNGDSKFSWISPAATVSTSISMGFFPYGDTKLISLVKNTATGFIDFYDCETGVSGLTTINSNLTFSFSTVYFNKYLFFFPNTSTLAPGYYWNGTAYGVCGYTGTGSFYPVGGNVYNHRAYLIQLAECAYWYSDIDAISGACTKIDLNGLVENSCTLSSIASFTLSDQTTTEEYQAFIMSNGEVLFYTGAYPDSPTWSIKGKSKVGQPLYVGSIIRYQGDSLLMCDSGVISMRALFLAGAEKAENIAANKNMQTTWRTLVQSIRTYVSTIIGPNALVGPIPGGLLGNIRGVYDSKTDRIIISFPFQLDESGIAINGSFYFVFYTPLEAWFFHQSTGDIISDICIYKNDVRLLAQGINQGTGDLELMTYTKEGATGFQDRNSADTAEVSYDYEMLSAPIPFPKTAVYEALQIEPILESDLYGQTNWNFVVDFGRQTSGDQKTDAVTTSVAKPAVNVGMQNITYVQVKMSGTTAASKTVGLDLYSYNVWFDSGQTASR